MNFDNYNIQEFFDELIKAPDRPRALATPLVEQINALSLKELRRKQKAAETALYQQGITFSVYGDKKGTEKIMPFDIIPRIIPGDEWQILERGLKQRIEALNLFLDDVYNEGKIFKDKVIPKEIVLSSAAYLKQCKGLKPAKKTWIHITGTDLVRNNDGKFYVLEDNLRCPSGISYVLQNRAVQKRIFPEAFEKMNVRPVSDYGDHLYDALSHVAPESAGEKPNIVVLTPGIYNSAYYEHMFLAQQMGVMLAEGSDLVVIDDHVMLRTTKGLQKVDVIYRRIDDEFMDPEAFRKDSVIGVPGLMEAYRKGNVTLANAPGTGIADDKAIYFYVPQMIKYYLGEDMILPNVPTYLCSDDKQREYVLKNLKSLVVKAVNLSGGYGIMIGPKATEAERKKFAAMIKKNPRNYIAQPVLSLSRAPTLVEDGVEGRHVDFRPYIVYGKNIFVLPGGLTRVALTKGSLIVNSSQGGGSKDTWVLSEKPQAGEKHSDA